MSKEIQTVVKNVSKIITRNSPTILTGLGVAGLITTTILAVRGTPKALSIIDDEVYGRYEESGTDETFAEWLGVKKDYDFSTRLNTLSTKEIVTLTWKCYIPAAIMGTVTIGCIIGANKINLRRNAALATVYSLSETALKEYQAKVVETIGKNKEKEIRDEIHKDRVRRDPVNVNDIVHTGKGETLCYDALSGRYFRSDIEEIKRALNKVSRDMLSENTVTLNDVYYELNLKGTKVGDLMGWHVDYGLIEPDFSSQLTEDGTPCLVLDFIAEPIYMYRD